MTQNIDHEDPVSVNLQYPLEGEVANLYFSIYLFSTAGEIQLIGGILPRLIRSPSGLMVQRMIADLTLVDHIPKPSIKTLT